MVNPKGLGIARVALTLQVTIAPSRLDALLRDADKELAGVIADRVDTWVREHKTGYYPALDFLVDQGAVTAEHYEALRALAALIRKRVKRDVQAHLWPVFSAVHIERAQSLCFLMPHFKAGKTELPDELTRHYFPNNVRLELVLTSLDKPHRLSDAVGLTEHKVVRNLLDVFESVTVSAARLVKGDDLT